MDFMKIFILCFFLFFGFVSADSITDVKIKSNVPLNEFLSISGQYVNVDGNSGILCSFKIFDQQTADKYLILRLSDEYTFSDGTFSSSRKITEPTFQRGFDYNFVVCCNIACYDQNFFVAQKDDILLGYNFNSLFYDVLYFRNPDVILPIILIVFVLFVIGWKIFLQR